MPPVSNVTRFLDAQKIKYTAFETPVEKLGAEETARFLDIPPETVYKTIVVLREKGKPILAIVPGPAQVDLKLMAKALGEKKLHLPTEREAEAVTGLQAGGISPLALLNKGFQVVMDVSAQKLPRLHISGGQRGLNIAMTPHDLARVVHARYENIIASGAA